MNLRRVLVVSACLTGCSSASAKPPPPRTQESHPPPTAPTVAVPAPKSDTKTAARQDRIVKAMLDKVTKLRGVQARREVPGVVLSRDQLIARVKQHVSVEVPPDAIEKEGTTLKLLGFVPLDFDYGKEMFALLESQLAGYYEPADGTMYMAADLDGLNSEATLAHELVHALQDQSWDLKSRSKYAPGQSDRMSSLAALAEGDATSAMADFVIAKMDARKTALDVPEEVFADQVAGSMSSGEAAQAPHVMRTSLVAPYVDGLSFVNALRRRGGWKLVDQAWADMPKTTEQILHVDKWLAKEPAVEVARPLASTLGPGFSVADEDTYGEQGIRLLFEEWMTPRDAKTAASGWGGDRGAIFGDGKRSALALHVRYDESKEKGKDAFADRAFRHLTGGLAMLAVSGPDGKPATKSATSSPLLLVKDKNFICVERPVLGPLAAVRKGLDIAIVAGPATLDGSKGKPADCAGARLWANEVLGK